MIIVCGNIYPTFRIQEQLRRIRRNQEKEKLQPAKKKKEKPLSSASIKVSITYIHNGERIYVQKFVLTSTPGIGYTG